MTGSNDNPRNGKRLDTWKEIGGFFGRDERTVKRWEMTRKLPVHRVPGGGRANVYAYEGELTEWLRSNDPQGDSGPEEVAAENGSGVATAETGVEEASGAAVEHGGDASAVNRSWGGSGLILAVLVIAAVVAGLLIYKGRDWLSGDSSAAAKTGAHKVAPESEQLYLKGIYYWHNRTPESLNQAVDYFTQAIVRDPNNAEAYVGLANCYNLLREYSTMPDDEAYPRAMAAAKRAIALDDSLSGAHSSLGFGEFYWSWDAPGAEKEFKRAIELDPKSVNAHHWYATMLMSLGREKESLDEIEKAQQLDPQSTAILADQGLIIYHNEQTERAIAELKQLEAAEPAFLSPHNYLAAIYYAMRDCRNYLAESKSAATLQHDEQRLKIVSAGERGLAASGARGMLTEILKVQKDLYAQGKETAYDLAMTSAALGERKDALKYLQTAYEKHEAAVVAMRVETAFKVLYEEKEFRELLQKVGLPPVE
jgi:tetratricopeptide (TPR) repeat protein